MQTFFEWLIQEARQPEVDQSILKGYEFEFKRQLEQLIQRTEDPELKQRFRAMLDCPVMDSSGRCRDFSEYIVSLRQACEFSRRGFFDGDGWD